MAGRFLSRHGTKLAFFAVPAAFGAGIIIGRKEARLAPPDSPSIPACAAPFTLEDQQSLLPNVLRALVTPTHVKAPALLTGARLGQGTALAVVAPGTLQEAVDVLKACVRAGVAVIPQGANTGLTGGSVPRDTLCDRPTVVIDMRRLKTVLPLDKGEKVLCFGGVGLLDLARQLRPLRREPHSVLGSVFLNPSTGAGVALGSGGTQLVKGPAYTERALYCRVTADGDVEVVNELGVRIKDPETLLAKIQAGELTDADLDPKCGKVASQTSYRNHVCKVDGAVARFNADTSGPDCCRCEGKVLILATLHDTFPMPQQTQVTWVACKDLPTAHALKRAVYLDHPSHLPTVLEYMDRDTVDVVDRAGRGLITAIQWLGMGAMGSLWDMKLRVQALPLPYANLIPDLALWHTNFLLPRPLSPALDALAKKYDHHLLVEVPEFGHGEIQEMEAKFRKWADAQPAGTVEWHTCTREEQEAAMVFRFVTAAAFRTFCVGMGVGGLSVDYALPKNYDLAPPVDFEPVRRLRYSHFGCNVVHEDLAFPAGMDVHPAKAAVKGAVEACGGRLPAEHGHGTEYTAPPETQQRWQRMDPSNTMNPGIGGLSYRRHYH